MSLERKTPLKRKTPLPRGGFTSRTSSLARSGRLKPVSDKKRAAKPDEAAVRAEVLAEGKCQIKPYLAGTRWEACMGRLTFHHVRKGSAGGGYTVANGMAACVLHNDWVEDHPEKARQLGLVDRGEPMIADATISANGLYRYSLTREWDPPLTEPPRPGGVLWIMLNPSTADEKEDDPTIRRCVSFTRSWRYSRLKVVNLYALRVTRPVHLADSTDPEGAGNRDVLAEALADWRNYPVAVAAWGAHKMAGYIEPWLMDSARSSRRQLHCLGTTKAHAPRHPLYVPATQELVPWTYL